MNWLSQNWIWVALAAVAVFWLLSRARHGGLMGGCGGHHMAHNGPTGHGKTVGAEKQSPLNKDPKAVKAAPPSGHQHERGGCCGS